MAEFAAEDHPHGCTAEQIIAANNWGDPKKPFPTGGSYYYGCD